MSLVFSLLFAVLSIGAVGDEATPFQKWESTLHADHRLVGKIWSTRDSQFIDPRSLVDALGGYAFVLIGETHDNADHHRLQAWLIEQIAKDRKPAVVMEMINRDQLQALQEYLVKPDANAAGLGTAIDWAARGWPDWSLYQPIAESAFRMDLPLVPGDADRISLGKVRSGGFEALNEDARKRLALDEPLSPQLSAALKREIGEAHCDLMPESSLPSMIQIQRYRDSVLANALVEADEGHGAFLIAGNGHVRTDRGVPWYLARQAPERTAMAVMLVEIEKGAESIDDLVPTGPGGTPAADYVWITPRAEREDPCERLRRHRDR